MRQINTFLAIGLQPCSSSSSMSRMAKLDHQIGFHILHVLETKRWQWAHTCPRTGVINHCRRHHVKRFSKCKPLKTPPSDGHGDLVLLSQVWNRLKHFHRVSTLSVRSDKLPLGCDALARTRPRGLLYTFTNFTTLQLIREEAARRIEVASLLPRSPWFKQFCLP